jgi:antitoxin component of RelBE/YafQ-DinJ toxin-antitoxin module
MSTEVLSIRVSRELKKEAEKLNIDIKDVVERALVDAIEQARRRKLEEAIGALLPKMEKISEEEWVRVVKECRREQ